MGISSLHPIQEDILDSLEYHGSKRFSELQGETPSNKLSFHLDRLQEKNLIEEVDEGYQLTADGIEAIPHLGTTEERPITIATLFLQSGGSVYLEAGDKTGAIDATGTYLQPPATRLESGNSLQEHGADLHSDRFDTGSPDLELSAVLETVITFDNGAEHDYLMFYLGGSVDTDGEDWYTPDEIGGHQVLPGMDEVARHVLSTDTVVHGSWGLTYSDGTLELAQLDVLNA